MQLAVEMWPCSMSATGLPREAIAARKSFMCPRIAGATCCSRSFSVLSSGYSSSSYVTSLWIGVPSPSGMKSYLKTLALSVPLSP